MATIKDILDWVRVAGDPTDASSPRGAFLAHMGCEEDEHPRNFGAISEADFQKFIDLFKLAGVSPTPVLGTKLGLAGRVARIIVGVQPTQQAQIILDRELVEATERATAAQLALAQAQVAQSQAVTMAAQKPKARVAKMAQVAEQGNEEEAPLLPQQAMIDGIRRWYSIFKTQPREEVEITLEQLSCIQYRLQCGLPPWVEFAVFGPNGNRLLRAMKMTGMVMMPDGSFSNQEFKGPPTFAMWSECYNILQTGLIFLDTVELGPLDSYKDMIQKYATAYPSL
jgi:hypothetical protein